MRIILVSAYKGTRLAVCVCVCIYIYIYTYSYSVTQSCLTLCDPMDCSMIGFPVLHYLCLLKLMSIESVIASNHLVLCCSLLLMPSVFPNEWAVYIRWPKYWSFSFSINPSNEYSCFISFRIDWFALLVVQGL